MDQGCLLDLSVRTFIPQNIKTKLRLKALEHIDGSTMVVHCMKPYQIKGSEYMIYCTANISHIALWLLHIVTTIIHKFSNKLYIGTLRGRIVTVYRIPRFGTIDHIWHKCQAANLYKWTLVHLQLCSQRQQLRRMKTVQGQLQREPGTYSRERLAFFRGTRAAKLSLLAT